jgi:CRP/FNR family transcriptional regulator, cyclic AMP receptor protein
VVRGSSLPGNAGDHAAGLTRRDLSSRHVPGSQVAPPIAVETFRRNVKTPELRRFAAIAWPACRLREREYIGAMAVSSPDLKAFLVATPFFGGLSEASLDLLIAMLVERRFEAGATVVAEGEQGRSMFVVQSGKLVVSMLGHSGSVIRMSDLEPGDFFGEMTLIEMQSRSATVVAESPTVLYELTARNLYTCYKTDIHAYVMVLQNINRELCRRLRRADNRFAEHLMLHEGR